MNPYTIQPCYDRSDQATTRDLKRLIWTELGGRFYEDGRSVPLSANMYMLALVLARVRPTNDSLYQYEKVLREVRRLNREAEEYKASREVGLGKYVNVYL
jgi:hypothetical protein